MTNIISMTGGKPAGSLATKENAPAGTEAACAKQGRADSTAIGQIEAFLLAGRGLTALEAWITFGCSRLAAVIHELRRRGMPIRSEIISVECADGRTAHVAFYAMAAPKVSAS